MPVSMTKPRKCKQTKLSLRILSQLPTREQLPLIGKIIHYCEKIQEGTQKFIEILPKGLSTFAEINRDDEVLIAKAISETNTDEVFESARNAYEALAEYARGFRIELVAE